MSRERLIISIALIASIAIHLFVLLPGLVEASSPGSELEEDSQLNKSEFKRRVEEEEKEDKLHLGIDESEASTLTWIGYEEYQEHMARLADVEQAELQAGAALPVAGGAPAAPDIPQATPQEPVDPATEASQQPVEPTTEPAEAQQPESNATPAETTPAPAPGPESIEPTDVPPTPGGLRRLPEGPAAPGEADKPQVGTITETPSETLPESKPTDTTEPVPDPKASEQPASTEPAPAPKSTPEETKPEQPKPPAKPVPPTTPSKPGPGGTAGDAPPGPNAPAAQEETAEDLPPKPNASKADSSATSTIKVPRKDWLKGKPLAAAGLRLFPRKPSFTALQGVTSGGSKNLIVHFEFGANGKPAKVKLVRGTGHPTLDRTFTASFYQWRAQGKPLRNLKKGERIPIQLEIVLTVK